MGAHEFGLHLELDLEESTGPQELPAMWAELMAAIANGPLEKRGGGNWRASDFIASPWAAPPPPPAPSAPTAESLRAFAGKTGSKHTKR